MEGEVGVDPAPSLGSGALFLVEKPSGNKAGHPSWPHTSQSCDSSNADRSLPSPPTSNSVSAVVSQMKKERATIQACKSIRNGDSQVRGLGWGQRKHVRPKGKRGRVKYYRKGPATIVGEAFYF